MVPPEASAEDDVVPVKEVTFTNDAEKNQWEYSQRGALVAAVREANTNKTNC